jgi:two-component system NtrC family response regulator
LETKNRNSEDRQKLLVIEDDPGLLRQLKWHFEGYEVITASTREQALVQLRRHEPLVVLQDLGLPPDDEGVEEGLACLRDILRLAPHTKVIVVTGNGQRDNALRAVAQGAYDFYQKPVDVQVLDLITQRAFHMAEIEAALRKSLGGLPGLTGMVGSCEAMLKLGRMIERVAPTRASTLVLGESGTGKELVARALHNLSPRANKPFIAINCAAIPENLLESELFGHEKGAFTGAVKTTPGKVESADGGTLFLDEIGDMPASLQAKLLRFLQERVVERVGGREPIPVDVRVVCATHRDLEKMIADGLFRQDLFFRIAEMTLNLPALRDRGGDVLLIARAILTSCATQHGRVIKGFNDDAQSALRAYRWPGNIRELQNRINSAVIMCDGAQVTAEDLSLPVPATEELPEEDVLNLRVARSRVERVCVQRAMARTEGNVTRAAELLGITRPTLYDMLEKLGMHSSAPAET